MLIILLIDRTIISSILRLRIVLYVQLITGHRNSMFERGDVSDPLAGIKIIDLTSVISGPFATMILADQGADVIKVENINGGDFTRSVGNKRGGFPASFLNNNRNKRSIAIDLKSTDGRAIFMKLVSQADALVQNFRPGTMERMGLGEKDVRQVAPDILYVSISGFGQIGPYAKKPVYDPLVQALSGLATVQAGADQERPKLVRTILPDKLTGVTAAQAITAGLLARARTGQGQHIELSMLSSVMSFLWSSDMEHQTFIGEEHDEAYPQSFLDLIYETTDGYISAAVQTDKQWLGLTRALEKPEWLEDGRFKSTVLRARNIDERLAFTQEVLKCNTSDYWLERLEAEDVPCAPVLTRSQVIDHPQFTQNDMFIQSEHKSAGSLRHARPAARFSHERASIRHQAPALGEHTDEILTELGFGAVEIAKFVSESVVAKKA